MPDPRESNRTNDDQQASNKPDKQTEVDELDVRPDDIEKVKGGTLEDPCGGGKVRRS
jgi:hypothetical protein